MYWSKNISQILSFCLCNFDQVVIVRSTLCKIYFPLRFNPKIQRKNKLSPSLCDPIFWHLMNFFLNYSFDGRDAPSGPTDDTTKTDFAVLGFDGGIWCPGSGSNDRINNVCMGVTCCSPCIHAEMEHWDLGQKPLKSKHLNNLKDFMFISI